MMNLSLGLVGRRAPSRVLQARPPTFPGEGRGPGGKQKWTGVSLLYLGLRNWAPASAGEAKFRGRAENGANDPGWRRKMPPPPLLNLGRRRVGGGLEVDHLGGEHLVDLGRQRVGAGADITADDIGHGDPGGVRALGVELEGQRGIDRLGLERAEAAGQAHHARRLEIDEMGMLDAALARQPLTETAGRLAVEI